ncbi:MAG: thermonuclease family protein [Pseudomonadota bacterium]
MSPPAGDDRLLQQGRADADGGGPAAGRETRLPLPGDGAQTRSTEALKAVEHLQLSPLSIQAASLVRSIESLSRIFWISIAGTFLTIFFAALAQLEVNAASEFISLGEYQVPKSIAPLSALLFAVFVFWLTSNRMRMLAYVLCSSSLPTSMVEEIFRLNPPVLNVFDEDNAEIWSPFNGIGVLIINWAVFFGNAIALTSYAALQRGATTAEFDAPQLLLFLLASIAVLCYGFLSTVPPLRQILSQLHGIEFHIGWPRKLGGLLLIAGVVVTHNIDQIGDLGDDGGDLLGPAIANAIDGETLFVRGLQVQLFGIDAMERDQFCQDAKGANYPCGSEAAMALQQLVQNVDVVCFPLFAVSEVRVVGICALHDRGGPLPVGTDEFLEMYGDDSLSRLQVEQGHALSVGVGEALFSEEQNQAQTLRLGIWQGSFQPPSSWRSQRD